MGVRPYHKNSCEGSGEHLDIISWEFHIRLWANMAYVTCIRQPMITDSYS